MYMFLKAGVMWLHMNVYETWIVPIGLMHVMAYMAVDVELKTYVLCDSSRVTFVVVFWIIQCVG
jgi:hypothetical protein